jgi:ATP-binding protein involved in chromosome partitioning
MIIEQNKVAQHIVAVMGGKGGVGKTTITALLACALRMRGAHVAILDGDLPSPTVANLFGIEDDLPDFVEEGLVPPTSSSGISVMSMNAYVENREDPFLWIGPMTASAFKQLYADTAWGELDYLLIDTPPGLSDIAITMLQSIPLDGTVIVSTSDGLATSAAAKCIEAAHLSQQHIFGIIENMSDFVTSDGTHNALYSESDCTHSTELAHVPLLGQLPFDPAIVTLCDTGHIEEYASEACGRLIRNFLAAIND